MTRNRYDWRKVKDWKFPYKGLNDPQYIKDRDELFMKNNNEPMPEMKLCTIKCQRKSKYSGIPFYKINLNSH